LLTLLGAQYVLYSAAIEKLGTDFHHKNFLLPAQTGKVLGCFALTGEFYIISFF